MRNSTFLIIFDLNFNLMAFLRIQNCFQIKVPLCHNPSDNIASSVKQCSDINYGNFICRGGVKWNNFNLVTLCFLVSQVGCVSYSDSREGVWT